MNEKERQATRSPLPEEVIADLCLALEVARAAPNFLASASHGSDGVEPGYGSGTTPQELFLRKHAGAIYRSIGHWQNLDEMYAQVADQLQGLIVVPRESSVDLAVSGGGGAHLELDRALLVSEVLRDSEAGMDVMTKLRRPLPVAVDLVRDFERSGCLQLDRLRVERHGNVGLVELQGNANLNAEDHELMRELEVAVDVVLLNPECEVGAIRGGVMSHPKYQGMRVFSAGINLKKLALGQIPVLGFMVQREAGAISKLIHGLVSNGGTLTRKPWIAVVDRFAVGGGAQLLLAVDFVLAANDAFISLPATKEGLIPGVAPMRLRSRVGEAAEGFIRSGQRIGRHDAMAEVFVDEWVAGEDLDVGLVRVGEEISKHASSSSSKTQLGEGESVDELRRYLAEFIVDQAVLMQAVQLRERERLSTTEG